VLITTSPGTGHVFPPISIAHALRAAGHDVLWATAGGDLVAHAGLPVFDSAPDVDTDAVFGGMMVERGMTFNRFRTERPEAVELAAELFAVLSDATTDRTVEVALDWRPDLVIYTELQAAGPLVASKLGVPAVEHIISVNHFRMISSKMRPWMDAAYDRHGVTGPPEVTAFIDTRPPSMREVEFDGWSMQGLPYNGARVLPRWLFARPSRPRVAITLGTLVPKFDDVGGFRGLVEAAGQVDAEFVLALGDTDLSVFGTLPDNVRAAGWVPLNALLATCTSMIHHVGGGTTLTGLGAGVTHLALPVGADSWEAGELLRKRGLGVVTTPGEVDAELIRTVLFDDGMRTAAAEVKAEVASLPTPADLVPQLEKLAG
jgi:UDP:flavonoid glycosyltransferase YjiC (YdhE family)